MRTEADKLPKGLSYVLKPSLLRAGLEGAGVEIDTHLIRSPGELFFDAHFWPPNPNVAYERLYVRAGTVANSEAHDARQYVEHVALPELIAWIGGILTSDKASPVRRQEQYIAFWWPD